MKKIISYTLALSIVSQNFAFARESRTERVAAATASQAQREYLKLRYKLMNLNAYLDGLEFSLNGGGRNDSQFVMISSTIALATAGIGYFVFNRSGKGGEFFAKAALKLSMLLSNAGFIISTTDKLSQINVDEFSQTANELKEALANLSQEGVAPNAEEVKGEIENLERTVKIYNSNRNEDVAIDIASAVLNVVSLFTIIREGMDKTGVKNALIVFTAEKMLTVYRNYNGTNKYKEKMLIAISDARAEIAKALQEL